MTVQVYISITLNANINPFNLMIIFSIEIFAEIKIYDFIVPLIDFIPCIGISSSSFDG